MATNQATYGVNQVDTNSLAETPVTADPDALYPPSGPTPAGTRPAEFKEIAKATTEHPDVGTGVEGEDTVWEARYALRNFAGRTLARIVLTIVWAGLAYYTWGERHAEMHWPTLALGVGLGVLWLTLIYRVLHARLGHFYRLTTRRLFVSTGVLNRRRDQLELLRVEDVYTRQSLFERWLGLGTVVVMSSEPTLPTMHLPGVRDPKQVMDLIWHHARAERDQRSVKVQEI